MLYFFVYVYVFLCIAQARHSKSKAHERPTAQGLAAEITSSFMVLYVRGKYKAYYGRGIEVGEKGDYIPITILSQPG